MRTKTKSNLFIIASVATVATGQVLLKYGLNKARLDFQAAFTKSIITAVQSPLIWIGIFLFAASSITWILAMSKADLSYGYPMMSLGYIIVAIISWLLLHETFGRLRMLGITIIALGILMLSKS